MNMKVLIGLVIFLLALIFSGILYMFGLVGLTPVPYNIWLLTSIVLFYGAYRFRFKNQKVLKFFLVRKWIEFNSWFYKIDRKMTVGNHKLNPMQERAVRLWKVSLKDKDCVMHCSLSTKERQVESGSILIVLSPTGVDHQVMSIFDSTDDTKCNFYELIIPQPHITQVCDQFDTEMGRRMRENELDKRDMVEDIMDTMVRRQEEMIKSKKPVLV